MLFLLGMQVTATLKMPPILDAKEPEVVAALQQIRVGDQHWDTESTLQ